MSSPLYISEKLESENPKWSEIEIESANGAANGLFPLFPNNLFHFV